MIFSKNFIDSIIRAITLEPFQLLPIVMQPRFR